VSASSSSIVGIFNDGKTNSPKFRLPEIFVTFHQAMQQWSFIFLMGGRAKNREVSNSKSSTFAILSFSSTKHSFYQWLFSSFFSYGPGIKAGSD